MTHHAAVALMLALAAASAPFAQPVYRCGNTYSQSPCPQAKLVEATDPRSAAQRAEAQRVVADERRLAAEMQRDRLAEQAALKPAAAASLSGAPIAPAAKAAERAQPKKKKHASARRPVSTDFVAVDPGSRPRRARHK